MRCSVAASSTVSVTTEFVSTSSSANRLGNNQYKYQLNFPILTQAHAEAIYTVHSADVSLMSVDSKIVQIFAIFCVPLHKQKGLVTMVNEILRGSYFLKWWSYDLLQYHIQSQGNSSVSEEWTTAVSGVTNRSKWAAKNPECHNEPIILQDVTTWKTITWLTPTAKLSKSK